MGAQPRHEDVAVLQEAIEEDPVPGLDRFLVGRRDPLHGLTLDRLDRSAQGSYE